MTASSPNDFADPPTRHLTWLYVAALSFVALLTIAGQVITQRSIARQLDDSRIVNLAGRQRMLSQRLTQLALRLEREPSPVERRKIQQQFSAAFASWKQTHAGLRFGNDSLSLPRNDSDVVEGMFARLDEAYLPMQQAGATIASDELADQSRLTEATEDWLARETAFLDGMDAIVFQYDAEARDRVARLRIIEAALLVATLATLAAEATLVFRPSVRRLRHYVERLRALNAELALAERRAVEADAAKTQFLAGMSHELRTPMSAILGASEISLERTDDPAAKRLLGALHQSAKTLSAMLDDLLDLASFDAGAGPQTENEPFDVRSAIEQVAELFRPSAERKGLTLTVRIDESVPNFALGDQKRLGQILSNLLSNAIKFTERGTVEMRAGAEATGDSERLIVEVVDTGPGVPPEQRERIFERFSRVDPSLRRRTGGAGLGLAISSELVRAMGGTIELDAERRVGSRFVLRLPLRRLSDLERGSSIESGSWGEPPDASPPARCETQGPLRRALIADDSDANRLLLAERLRDLGFAVMETGDGSEALAAAGAHSFHAILLDVEMPGLDGLAVAHALRERPSTNGDPAPLLIAITAHPLGAIESRCVDAGFDAVLRKPASLSSLRQALHWECSERVGAGKDVEPFSSPPSSNPGAETRTAEQIQSRFQRREALLFRLIELYLAESEELHERLGNAVASADAEQILLVVHRWKGTCSNFGWSELDDAFQQFETTLSAEGPASLQLSALSDALERFEKALRRIRDELSDQPPSSAATIEDQAVETGR